MDFMVCAKLSPMVCKVESVALCISKACIELRNIFIFNCNQDSTAFKSVICLLISSGDSEGMVMPGTFIAPHILRTNSMVSFIAFMPGISLLPDCVDMFFPKNRLYQSLINAALSEASCIPKPIA